MTPAWRRYYGDQLLKRIRQRIAIERRIASGEASRVDYTELRLAKAAILRYRLKLTGGLEASR
jgi:hypothetical protein